MISAESMDQRERGLMLAQAFAERRRRHPFNPNVWVGSGGIVGFVGSYILALCLLASTLTIAWGCFGVLFSTIYVIGTASNGYKIESDWYAPALVSLGMVVGVLIINKLLIALLGLIGKYTQPRTDTIPYWATELFSPQTPWREQANELLLSGQSGISLMTALEAERRGMATRRTLIAGVATFLGLIAIAALVGTKLVMAVSLMAMPGVLLTSLYFTISPDDRKLRCMNVLYRWNDRGRGIRLYGQAGSIAAALVGLFLFSTLSGIVTFTSAGWLGITYGSRTMTYSLLAFYFVALVGAAAWLARERISAPNLYEKLDPEQVNAVFARYVAEELSDDPDAVAASGRIQLPRRKEWVYPWDLLLDIVAARGFPDGKSR